MLQTTISIPNAPDFSSAARLRGRARGALICAAFGAIWVFEALFFGAKANLESLLGVALIAIGFIVWPLSQLRSLRHFEVSPAEKQRWKSVARPYWTNVAIEWLACWAACVWLALIRRYDLIPQALGIVIGLHFFPLAKMFRMSVYHGTAVGMVLAALATLAIPSGHLRDFAAYGVNGLSLWITAAVILCQDRSCYACPSA
jgi:hypothetical protein